MLVTGSNVINIGTAGLIALMGYIVVFGGLLLLMLVVTIIGKALRAPKEKVDKTEEKERVSGELALANKKDDELEQGVASFIVAMKAEQEDIESAVAAFVVAMETQGMWDEM